MEAVLASAAYLEQGIAWGKFCLSNSCLKHALCVGTKNYLSAEAVSYKNGIFHWVLFWRPFSPRILFCCWLAAAISLFACTGLIRLVALLGSNATQYFQVIWWPESSFSLPQNDRRTRRGGSQFDFCFSVALNLDLFKFIGASKCGGVGGFLVSSLQSEPECGRAQASEFFMEVRGLMLWCLVLSIFVGLIIGKCHLLFRLIGGNSS